MALAAASWAHDRPRLGCLAASCRVRTRTLAAAPRLRVYILPPFGHARTCALVAAPQVVACQFRARASAAAPLSVARECYLIVMYAKCLRGRPLFPRHLL